MGDPPVNRLSVLGPMLLSLVLAGYFVRSTTEINGDGRLAYVYALVDRGTAVVDGYVRERPSIRQDLATADGHDYMAKPPLPAMLAVPVYAALRLVFPPADMTSWLWRWLLTLLVSGGSLAAVVLLTAAIARRAGVPRATLAGIATAIATPLVVYATVFIPTTLAAALLAGTLLATIGPPRARPLVGPLFGGLVSTDPIAAAAGAVLFGHAAVATARERAWRRLALLALGAVAGALPLLLYQLAVFGSPVSSMYAHLADPVARQAYAELSVAPPRPDVLATLLLSPQHGLFVYAPVLLVGTAALAMLARRAHMRTFALLSAGGALAALIALAWLPPAFVFWHDRAEYGPRLLLAVVPLLGWGLGALPARALAALTLVAAIPQLVALSVHEPLLAPGSAGYVELLRRFAFDEIAPSFAAGALGGWPIPAPSLAAYVLFGLVAALLAACLMPRTC